VAGSGCAEASLFDIEKAVDRIGSNVTISCRLTDFELRERRNTVLRKAGRAVLEAKELKSGFAYRFPAEDSWLDELVSIIRLERQCCPFLTFRLTAEPENGPLWLEITGPPEAKEFLAEFLG